MKGVWLAVIFTWSCQAKYIELDHALVPGNIGDINKRIDLPGRVKKPEESGKFLLNKYQLNEKNFRDVLAKKAQVFEPVIGTDEEVFFDHDFGFFSAVIASYNNHWVLRTSPDDWWNVIVRNVAQAIDDNGNKTRVRNMFVDHDGKKKNIDIRVGSLDDIDYSWLFDQFSKGIAANIKTPGYVETMTAKFSTTGPEQLISTQIMLMSSLQKYFSYSFGTECGIPGVEMLGTEQDWQQLLSQTAKLEKLLKPVMEDIGLERWFADTNTILTKLLETQRDQPDKDWWGHVLSWNERYGSGSRSWWSGWMIDFLLAGQAEKPQHFQSGLVSVPVTIDDNGSPKDTGRLVAGTVGFTVKQDVNVGRPVVQARQGWGLLLPKGSPITPLLLGNSTRYLFVLKYIQNFILFQLVVVSVEIMILSIMFPYSFVSAQASERTTTLRNTMGD